MPSKVTDIAYGTLLEKINKHFNTCPSVIIERYKFHSRIQQPGESITAFVAELRKLTEFCGFGDTVNKMLRDRFVAGLNNTRIQHHLLAETTLTFTKAQEIAQAMELAERDVQSIQADSQTPVHKIVTPPVVNNDRSTQSLAQPPSGGQTSRQCYRCGGKHSANSCYFKNALCHSCGVRVRVRVHIQGLPF